MYFLFTQIVSIPIGQPSLMQSQISIQYHFLSSQKNIFKFPVICFLIIIFFPIFVYLKNKASASMLNVSSSWLWTEQFLTWSVLLYITLFICTLCLCFYLGLFQIFFFFLLLFCLFFVLFCFRFFCNRIIMYLEMTFFLFFYLKFIRFQNPHYLISTLILKLSEQDILVLGKSTHKSMEKKRKAEGEPHIYGAFNTNSTGGRKNSLFSKWS